MRSTTTAALRLIPSLIFVFLPQNYHDAERQVGGRGQTIVLFWESFLSISLWPIVIIGFAIGIWISSKEIKTKTKQHLAQSSSSSYLPLRKNTFNNEDNCDDNYTFTKQIPSTANITLDLSQGDGMAVQLATRQAVVCIAGRIQRNWHVPAIETMVLLMATLFVLIQSFQMELQSLEPMWTWHPFTFMLGYNVYRTEAMKPNVREIMYSPCMEEKTKENEKHDTDMQCLFNTQWNVMRYVDSFLCDVFCVFLPQEICLFMDDYRMSSYIFVNISYFHETESHFLFGHFLIHIFPISYIFQN